MQILIAYLRIHAYTSIYLQYLHIPMYTCLYTHIPTYTCTYMHIPDTPNLKMPYLGNQGAVRPEPKNRFNNRPFPTNCAGLWHMERIRHDMAAQQKLVREVNLGAPEHPKYASDFTASFQCARARLAQCGWEDERSKCERWYVLPTQTSA